MEDERTLVQQAQAGDGAAFAKLYEGYFDKIYRYLILRVGSKMEAEDLTEQVFLKALEALPSFKWRGAPLPPGSFASPTIRWWTTGERRRSEQPFPSMTR